MLPMLRILTLPFKAVFAVYFRVIMPVMCHYLDRLDKDHHFTIGYHVEAIKISLSLSQNFADRL